MNKEQKEILKSNSGFCYFPYEFQDAIDNHVDKASIKNELKDKKTLSEMGKFWKFIEKRKFLWQSQESSIDLNQEAQNQFGTLVFFGYGVESIDVYKDKKIDKIRLVKSIFKDVMVGVIPIDYKVSKMKLVLNFRYGLAEPFEIKVNLNQYKEPEIDYQATYISKMKVSFGLGQDLLNVYFQLADERVDKTEVVLFKIFERNESRMIAKYEVGKGMYYYTIQGLAFGTYEFQVVQYVKDKVLVESPKTKFILTKPNYSGKPLISGL
jgi:hypothetical protein